MKIQFVSGVAVIAADPPESRKLYVDALGLPLEQMDGGEYYASEKIDGAKHFGVWPLSQAAQACYGTDTWPEGVPIPQVSVEFEVASPEAVAPAAEELRAAGYEPVHEPREEPWGQTIARILSPEDVIVGISYAPWHHSDG
jgi:catechol 2,3-dioxygenase-like lactoylglutathione lyase family enzyme